MFDATQPRMARGTTLLTGVLVAALFALLAFAPFASAASDPIASGTTTITLNSGFTKTLKKNKVKLSKISPAKVKGKTVTLPVSGGSLDPTTGLGTLTHKGGLKLKLGEKSVTLKNIELNTSKKSVSAKVGKKKLKVATVSGLKATRNGFGVDVKIGKLKLTSKAAKELNKALAPAAKKGKSSKRASTSKATSIFKANQVLGGSTSTTQPSTVTVLPGGTMTLAANPETLKKLFDVGVKIEKIGATSEPLPGTFGFPITGGTVSPTATAGTVQSSGGLNLVQEFNEGKVKTVITQGAFFTDLSAKTVTVEVVAQSNASEKLNLGNLGRASIADLSLTGATVTSDATAHTVSVQNAPATLQPVAAEVLSGFRAVAEGGLVQKLVVEGKTKPEAEAIAAAAFAKDHINAGDPLGTISFTAQTQ